MLENVDLEITSENVLVLRVDLNKPALYGTYRNVVLGTSHGNVLLWRDGKPDSAGIRFNLSVFRPFAPGEKPQR